MGSHSPACLSAGKVSSVKEKWDFSEKVEVSVLVTVSATVSSEVPLDFDPELAGPASGTSG